MDECPESEKIKYAGIGASVYFTTLMAGLSAYFAFQLIFRHFFVSIGLSLIWAGLIFNLDRFLVSSFRKKGNTLKEFLQAFPRICMAVFIALVISKPLELKLFQSEIDFKLLEIKREKLRTVEAAYTKKMRLLDAKEKEYRETLQNSFRLKESYYAQYKCECDGTCGTRNAGRGSECLRKQEKYESYSKEHRDLQAQLNTGMNLLAKEKLEYKHEKEMDKKEISRYFSKGLLSRLEALSHLSGNTSLAILLLFIFLETAPILSKLFAPVGPYDHLLQSKEYPFRVAYLGQIRENPIIPPSIPKATLPPKASSEKKSASGSEEQTKREVAENQLAQLQEKLVKQLLNRKIKSDK
jgi:hypothetical protein